MNDLMVPAGLPIAPSDSADALNGHDARLICDLIANMRKPADVLASHGLTIADLALKAKNPIFAASYREAKKVWASDMNINERIRLKSSFMLEDSLLTLFTIIRSEGVTTQAKLDAIEQLTKISTVTNVPKEGLASERHNISINIGGGVPPIKIVAETSDGPTTITAGT